MSKPDFITAADFLAAVRTGKAADRPIKATLPTTVKATSKERVLRFVISDGSTDRMGDTVSPNGWKLGNFKRNPVVLWSHNHDLLPLAKCVAIFVEGGRLIADAEFAPASINPMAEQALQAYRGGFLNAVSVGFMPLKWSLNKNDGIDFKEQELWEFSAVTVPANPNALIQGRSAPPAKRADDTQPPSLLGLRMLQLTAMKRR